MGRFRNPDHALVHTADDNAFHHNVHETSRVRQERSHRKTIGWRHSRQQRGSQRDGEEHHHPGVSFASDYGRSGPSVLAASRHQPVIDACDEVHAALLYTHRSCGGVSYRLLSSTSHVIAIVTRVIVDAVRTALQQDHTSPSSDAHIIPESSELYTQLLQPTGFLTVLRALQFAEPAFSNGMQAPWLEWPVTQEDRGQWVPPSATKHSRTQWDGAYMCLWHSLVILEDVHQVWSFRLFNHVCLCMRASPQSLTPPLAQLIAYFVVRDTWMGDSVVLGE